MSEAAVKLYQAAVRALALAPLTPEKRAAWGRGVQDKMGALGAEKGGGEIEGIKDVKSAENGKVSKIGDASALDLIMEYKGKIIHFMRF